METEKRTRPSVAPSGIGLPGLVLLVLTVACRTEGRDGLAAAAPAERPATLTVAERVFDSSTGFGEGWGYWGWAPSEHAQGKPARVDFSGQGGWILARPGLEGTFGGLRFRLRAPDSHGDFLEIKLDSDQSRFPLVPLASRHQHALEQGWKDVFVSMSELDPENNGFDRILFHARRSVGKEPVEIEAIVLTREGGAPKVAVKDTPARAGTFRLSCAAPLAPISPLIYGIAWTGGKFPSSLGATARRWGGNPASRYNWEHGHAWNTAADWFFTNVDYTGQQGKAWERYLDENKALGLQTALTVPIMGWVAKDTRSYSFPVSVLGPQQQVAPENPDAGNGLDAAGKPIQAGTPLRTSAPAPPEFVGRWVRAIRERDRDRGRGVQMYILDNEPMLWNTTHHDVHPEPTSYDELLDRTIRYGSAVREADPEAVIAGPALWGWPAYLFSAVDSEAGFTLAPDRRRHGNVPLLPWWLAQLRDHEKKTGKRLVDVVDVHYYPQANGVAGQNPSTSRATNALRIRMTRSLWDPTYKDESWIDDNVMLIPRLQKWIDENNPGLGISIGEWNFGAEKHMSGGLAAAEALGRFGALGVRGAFYWTFPPDKSPAAWAFRAYRNFDGAGARFLDHSVKTEGQVELASLFASRDEAGERLVAVLLNHDPDRPLEARLELGSCVLPGETRAFGYTGGATGLQPLPAPPTAAGVLTHRAPPYSITVLELRPPGGQTPPPKGQGSR